MHCMGLTMLYKDTILFATQDCTMARIEAREYITKMGLTQDNAKMVARDRQMLVILKEDTEL